MSEECGKNRSLTETSSCQIQTYQTQEIRRQAKIILNEKEDLTYDVKNLEPSFQKTFSRRELFKYGAALTTLLGTGGLFEARAAGISNPVSFASDLASIVNWTCAICDVQSFCVRIHNGEIQIGPQLFYQYPVGFMEATKALEFGASAPVFGIVSTIFAPLISLIAPFLPQGDLSIESYQHGQTYFQTYPHWLGIPAPVLPAWEMILNKANGFNPICLACGIIQDIINIIKGALASAGGIVKEVLGYLGPVEKAIKSISPSLSNAVSRFGGGSGGGNAIVSKLQGLLKKIKHILHMFETFFAIFPLLPSELFFFIWTLPMFSPDEYTIAPLFDSIMTAVPPLEMVCPSAFAFIMQHASVLPGSLQKLLSVLDPSFICVGDWGFGYPRIGETRSDDPIVAGLLSIARFHHLFSHLIPLIYITYGPDIRYQLYNPKKTGCFKPGYYFSDPFAQFLADLSLSNIMSWLSSAASAVSTPSSLLTSIENIANSAKSAAESAGSTLLKSALPNYRDVGVVVWQQKTKCCFSI